MIKSRATLGKRITAALLCPFVICVILLNGGLFPLARKLRRVESELLRLEPDLQAVRLAAGRASTLADEEENTDRKLASLIKGNIYSEDDIYMKLNLQLYDFARDTGVAIISLSQEHPSAENWMDNPHTGFFFKPFEISVEARGNLDSVYRYIELIEKDNVFCALAEIALRSGDMETFDVLLKIDWPVMTQYALEEIAPAIRGM